MGLSRLGGFPWVTVAAFTASMAGACAADPGDDPKGEGMGASMIQPGGSGGGSGGGGVSDASTPGNPSPGSDDTSAPVEAAAPDDGSTPMGETGTPPAPSCTSCPLTVEYYTRAAQAASPTITFDIAISNGGAMPQALSDLTARYWFTAEGVTSFKLNEYYAGGSINTHVTGTFHSRTATTTPPATSTADTYVEIAFDPAAGSIGPLSSTNDIQLAFNDTTYRTNFNESNDYSYTATDTMAACAGQNNAVTCQSMKVTLYQKGILAWGKEPGGATAPAGDP